MTKTNSVVEVTPLGNATIQAPFFYGYSFVLKTNWILVLFSNLFCFTIAALPGLNVFAISYISEAVTSNSPLLLPAIFLVVNFGIGIVLLNFQHYCDNLLKGQVTSKATNAFAHVLAHVPAHVYLQPEFLQLSRAGRTAIKENAIFNNYNSNKRLFAAVVSSISLGMALWNINHLVAILAILAPLPIILNSRIRAAKMPRFWRTQSEYQRRMYYFLTQLVYQRQAVELSTLNGAHFIAEKTNQFSDKSATNFVRMEKIFVLLELLFGFLTLGIYGSCIYLLSAELNLVLLVAAVAGLTSYIEALRSLNTQLKDYIDSFEPIRKYQEFIHTPSETRDFLKLPMQQSLKFTDVSVKYKDVVAVAGVDIDLQLGGFTALVGVNGSGKTSLIKALMGVQPQVSGTIEVLGQQSSIEHNQHLIPFISVQQEYGRFEIAVRDYLCIGLNFTPTDEQMWTALERVQLADYVKGLAQGLDTQLGEQWEQGINLSGGQWQRLAIARIFLSQARLVFLDEPTSAVDAAIEEQIFNEINLLSKERLILLTTHRASTLQHARQIYVMRAGKIVEVGTFAQLNKPGTHFHEIFASQLVA